ncbi:MAG: type II CRISPR RNA-guided endonuclease Cas9, partial [Paludibacteraceae bacterium]|nr:type II CRISPR RNA-guided endonuclease Cas9 [Paludibacteraceae bacterium]
KSKDLPELNFDAENPRHVSTSRLLYEEEKLILLEELTYRGELKKEDVLKLLFENYKDLDLNFPTIEGNRTMAAIYTQLLKIVELSGHGEYKLSGLKAEKIKEIVKEVVCDTLGMKSELLDYNTDLDIKQFEQQPIFKLWHLLYSFEGDSTVTGDGKLVQKLVTLTGLDEEYAKVLAQTTFQSDYGSLSTKAMSRLLPHLRQGLRYDEACAIEYKTHSKQSLTKEELENKEYKDRLDILSKNSLRNPVVEKIINQMIHVVNGVIDAYGKPDEIRIELARDLKKNADERAQMTDAINKTTKEHEDIRKILQTEFGLSYVSRTDIIRYKLYKELEPRGYHTLYSDTYIPREKLFSKEFDIEHIIPQSKLFNDSFANKTLEARDINIEKGNKTAYDYVREKYGEEGIDRYQKAIDTLNISKSKKRNLLTSEADIPKDFIERDLRDTQYIAKKSRELLLELVPFVVSTTGSITDRLREDWQLINVLQELNWDKYDRQGLTYFEVNRDGHRLPRIKDWTKRNDHRHHAMDALTIAFTKPSFIQYLNNLNARSDKSSSIYGIEQKELHRASDGHLLFNPPMPLGEFRAEARRHLSDILVSIKAKNKVVTRNVNTTKTKGGVNKKVELTPRGRLHEETIYGRLQEYETSFVKVGAAMTLEQIRLVANAREREALLTRLCEFGGDAKKAFTGKNSLEKNPIYLDAHQTEKLADKVKCVKLVERYTIRKDITPDLKLDKVVDAGVRSVLQHRIDEFGGDAKKAFANLDENPIYLNKEKGIKIKRVAIYGVSNAVALHDKHDKDGRLVLDAEGKKQSVDFVSTGSNHHVAIYCDTDGNLQEQVVSVYEATQRVMQGLPIVDKHYKADEGWQFLFTMKQNEYFVFPRYETRINEAGEEERICTFDPSEIDLMNLMNYELISQNLYRAQKLATKYYVFRHHLETKVDDVKDLQEITWKRIQNTNGLFGIIKVRINHIGQIVSVGEY